MRTSHQDTYTWFADITGELEDVWLMERRFGIIQSDHGPDLIIQNLQTGEKHEAGHFSVHSIDALSQSLQKKQSDPPPLAIHIRMSREGLRHVDVAHLQAHAKPGSMFQVASNFNCAEVAHSSVQIDGGNFVSNLAIDRTQGPAASASAGVSAITRMHATFYDPSTDPQTWGQTSDRQIELLGHPLVSTHFPVINGKLIFRQTEPRTYSKEELFPNIRIGLHQRARAYFGYRNPPYMEKMERPPIIDQVFVAALNRRAPLPIQEHLEDKTNLLLDAAYGGTYLAAKHCETLHLVLTLVGGGSFGNPPSLIARAIAQAHQEYGTSTNLESVVLPLFPIDGIVQGQNFVALLEDEFAKRGMEDLLSVVYV